MICTFPKKLRLLDFNGFNNVFKNPQKIISKEIIIFSCANKFDFPRIGFIITKKNIKQAHERNRIKRLIREYFRLNQHKLPSMDFVVLVKQEILDYKNHTINNLIGKLWNYYF